MLSSETVVKSEIVRSDRNRIALDWYLTDSGGRYRISDLAVGSLSTKIALRNQFASWIANNGGRFSALLAVLRQQTAQRRNCADESRFAAERASPDYPCWLRNYRRALCATAIAFYAGLIHIKTEPSGNGTAAPF